MEKRYITVFALNKYIKAKMNKDSALQDIYIKGEISNYRPHPSGHLYFTLKDEHSRISAVMFASQTHRLEFQIENGMQVFIHASVSVYEVSGQYQLYVQSIQQDGVGQLYLKFETLKKKLSQEGLFDVKHKKRIPEFPRSIAILSAKQGAAVQDVVRTIHLRFPFTKVIVFPIPVQGQNAYLKIIETLKQVDELGFDTIILARGGGSIEDLWNFNEESLARCVFTCQTPIISGIGHETDFTICDFVSDCRCATPTAAAMEATPDQNEMRKHCENLKKQLVYKMNHYLTFHQNYLVRLQKTYYLTKPEALYSNEILRLTQLQDQLTYQFKMFDMRIYQQLKDYQLELKQVTDILIKTKEHQLQKMIVNLDALSPLKVMQRGYTLIKKENQVIKSSQDIHKGEMIDVQFYDGIKKAEVK
ncbi:exodeoxyribonuclease VII large subunit [Candidatus Stoquefichus massiliensis]|uniref:exodeoxyribonuclease VII large subunit n=1 Tax=Candidatus Stoquefichus massiliensis TaxID=1470350 RepID=UPI000480F23E|nr:exodeoxyribonuclease VII large subunit [Candidatus Stoquefichus massiliensis]